MNLALRRVATRALAAAYLCAVAAGHGCTLNAEGQGIVVNGPRGPEQDAAADRVEPAEGSSGGGKPDATPGTAGWIEPAGGTAGAAGGVVLPTDAGDAAGAAPQAGSAGSPPGGTGGAPGCPGACSSGQTQTSGCGNCGKGTHTRTCGADCQWSAWSACAGEPECAAGFVDTQGCGCGGTRSRACNASCTWDAWSACTVPAQCTPSQVQCDCGTNGTGHVCQANGCWSATCVSVQPPNCGAGGTGGAGGSCGNTGASCTQQSQCCAYHFCQTHQGAPGYLTCLDCIPKDGPCWVSYHCCPGTSCSGGQPGSCE